MHCDLKNWVLIYCNADNNRLDALWLQVVGAEVTAKQMGTTLCIVLGRNIAVMALPSPPTQALRSTCAVTCHPFAPMHVNTENPERQMTIAGGAVARHRHRFWEKW